jgi:predicted small secreted protein
LPAFPVPVSAFRSRWRKINVRKPDILETTLNKTFHRIPILLFLCVLVLSLGACRTMSGVGQDISKAGDEITEEAEEHDD